MPASMLVERPSCGVLNVQDAMLGSSSCESYDGADWGTGKSMDIGRRAAAGGFGGSGNMTERVPVASSEHVAEIVGRQGSKIKALRAKTNTYIKTPVRGEEPVFVVTGRKDDVAAAKQEILSIADHFNHIQAGRSSVRNVSTGTASTNDDVTGSSQVTIRVRVPYRVVGLVVGPKGATIKRIQQDSQTYIVTPSRDREPVFEVTGSSESVERARKEIEGYIALRTGTGPVCAESLNASNNASNNSATQLRRFSHGGTVDDSNVGCDFDRNQIFGIHASEAQTAALMSYNNSMNLRSLTACQLENSEANAALYLGLLAAQHNRNISDNEDGNKSPLFGNNNNNDNLDTSPMWSQMNPDLQFPNESISSLFPCVGKYRAFATSKTRISILDGQRMNVLPSKHVLHLDQYFPGNNFACKSSGSNPSSEHSVSSGTSSNSPSASPTETGQIPFKSCQSGPVPVGMW